MKLKKAANQICKSLKMAISVFLAILYRNTLLKTAGRCRFVFLSIYIYKILPSEDQRSDNAKNSHNKAPANAA